MDTLNKVNKSIAKIVAMIAGILLAIMVVITFCQVIIRLIKGSLPWSEEAARYMQIYLTFLGLSVGTFKDELVSVEAMYTKLPEKAKRINQFIVHIIIAVISGLLIVYGFMLTQVTMIQSSSVLGLKMGYVYFAVVLGSVLIFIHNLIQCVDLVISTKNNNPTNKRIEVKE